MTADLIKEACRRNSEYRPFHHIPRNLRYFSFSVFGYTKSSIFFPYFPRFILWRWHSNFEARQRGTKFHGDLLQYPPLASEIIALVAICTKMTESAAERRIHGCFMSIV